MDILTEVSFCSSMHMQGYVCRRGGPRSTGPLHCELQALLCSKCKNTTAIRSRPLPSFPVHQSSYHLALCSLYAYSAVNDPSQLKQFTFHSCPKCCRPYLLKFWRNETSFITSLQTENTFAHDQIRLRLRDIREAFTCVQDRIAGYAVGERDG